MVDAIDRAIAYVAGMDATAFAKDTRTQDAVIRSIEIIGEAANKVRTADPVFAALSEHTVGRGVWDAQPSCPRLFKVDLQVVWQTVQQGLPR